MAIHSHIASTLKFLLIRLKPNRRDKKPSADADADVDGMDAIVEPPWTDLRRVAEASAHSLAG